MSDIPEVIKDDLTTAALYGFHQRDDEVAALKTEIERLRGLIVEVMSTRPYDPSRPYEVFTADISWKPRAAKACGVEVLEKTRFVSSGMVIKDDEG